MADYMGQYHGWHFFVGEVTLPNPEIGVGAVVMATAVPPRDGKNHATVENLTPPDANETTTTIPGTIRLYGASKAEAIAKVVEAVERLVFPSVGGE